MILGIGTDIVGVERFSKWLKSDGLLRRYFGSEELEWCKSQGLDAASSLAVRFAAKEAFGKALGTGLRHLRLSDIQVSRQELGKPELRFGKSAQVALAKLGGEGRARVHLSLSHDAGIACAFVVIEAPESI